MNAVRVTESAGVAPLRCERIVKRYGGRAVLNGVTLEIPRGAVLGLIGRNGAGKSTLIRVLLGLQSPDAGSASLLGECSLELSDAVKARLGYAPQQPDALNWMRVKDMLDFIGRQYPHWDEAFVQRSLARWQVAPEQTLSRLSPGERQRVALIRAFAMNPELLVLDEPAAALDPVARRELLREIALRAGEAGTTVLFSTHIVSDLERVASDVALLHQGRLLFNAPRDEIAERYLRVALPVSASRRCAAPLPGELSRRQRADGGLTVVVEQAPGAAATAGILAQGRADALSLEDLFIEVTE
jgi:ABC-2 type transport system ATP-binding protein